MVGNRINVILGAKDDASKTVTGLRGQFERFAADAKAGFGLGAGIQAFSLLQRGIGAVTDIIGDAVRAAAAEEAQIALLTNAIKENDSAWDGNVDALEAVIRERQKLAFSDGEQRDSLRSLVSVTGDLSKALEVQRTAMDLARLKGMSLGAATELLGKVYAGNLSTLSRYGIVLRKGATATEAMAEIQRRAAGQAETYANTTQGKMVRAQIALQDALEDLGKALTPLMADFAEFAADVIPQIMNAIAGLGAAFNDLNRFLQPHIALQQDIASAATKVAEAMGLDPATLQSYIDAQAALEKLRQEQMEDAEVADEHRKQLSAQFWALIQLSTATHTAQDASRALRDMDKEAAQAIRDNAFAQVYGADAMRQRAEATEEVTEAERIARSAAEGLMAAQTRSASLTGAYSLTLADAARTTRGFGAATSRAAPLLRAWEPEFARSISYAKAWRRGFLTSVLDIGPSMRETVKSNREEVRAAMTDLRWAMEHPFAGDRYIRFLEKKQKEAMRIWGRAVRQGKDDAAAEAEAVVDAINAELAQLKGPQVVTVTVRRRGSVGERDVAIRGHGGPVLAGGAYIVGERGEPELLQMGSRGGHVTPLSGMSASLPEIVVNVDGEQLFRIMDRRGGDRWSLSRTSDNYRSAQ